MKKVLSSLFVLFLLCSCGGRVEDVANSMQFRNLGNTGIAVSEIGIGCGAFSEMDSAQSLAFMDVAIDSGVNYIDIYDATPKVRSNIGYALQGRRDKMIIQGHIGCYWNGQQYAQTRDVELAQQGFADLLDRLQTDYIDVGMIHIVDNPAQWDSLVNSPFMDYVKDLKKEGKIKHIGLSSHNAEAALKAVKSGIVEVLMFSINPVFDRLPAGVSAWSPDAKNHMKPGIDPIRVELYDYCAQKKIGVTVMKAFGSGGGILLDANRSALGKAMSVDQCLAYCLAKPCVATVVCGAKNVDELLADLHYLHASESEKDYYSVLNNENGSNAGGAEGDCTYCNHCLPCPQGIDIAKVNALVDKAEAEGGVSDQLQQEYDNLEHHAGECTECGSCETRCPFGVPVRERMKQAEELFGK